MNLESSSTGTPSLCDWMILFCFSFSIHWTTYKGLHGLSIWLCMCTTPTNWILANNHTSYDTVYNPTPLTLADTSALLTPSHFHTLAPSQFHTLHFHSFTPPWPHTSGPPHTLTSSHSPERSRSSTVLSHWWCWPPEWGPLSLLQKGTLFSCLDSAPLPSLRRDTPTPYIVAVGSSEHVNRGWGGFMVRCIHTYSGVLSTTHVL